MRVAVPPEQTGAPAVPARACAAERLPAAVTLIEPDSSLEPITPGTAIPTRDTVLNLLTECTIAHFACHGVVDPVDPSQSRMLLHDHADSPFTVDALAPIHLDHARLAYLSACETALTYHAHLIDESIHLASAFQLAGYRHVVGTLWPIDDRTSVTIADTFYAKITPGEGGEMETDRAALALHDAVRALRDDFPTTPVLWACYTHTGA
ncbi:CHAT domain-containing protein [Nocardia sp. NPDC050793]|uniref:CHAT domain-containing protein n=1 Tax=Nocardia sp. NPDC050793 TaxID=3155159 RepID=UPI0034043606